MCNPKQLGAKQSAAPPRGPEQTLKEEYGKSEQNQSMNGSPMLLLLCASGICGCYLCYGQVQEKMFSKGSGSKAIQEVGSVATFMLVLSCVTNVVVARFWVSVSNLLHASNESGKTVGAPLEKRPLNHVLLLSNAFTYFAAMTASNEALGYVSYPTAVLAKSSKLIPTMVIGFLLERRSFSADEWCSATLITAGITIFNLSRMTPTNEEEDDGDSLYGLFLLFFSLGMDGLLGFFQGGLKKESSGRNIYRIPTALECMLWVNAYAILFMLPLSVWSGQWANGMELLRLDNQLSMPMTIRRAIILLNVSAAAGQIFIFFTIQRFSPLMCTTITTTRKFLTILFSVWSFGHQFTAPQWSAIAFVFGGLYFAIVSKFSKAKRVNAPNFEKKNL